jgi:hypothetical protein
VLVALVYISRFLRVPVPVLALVRILLAALLCGGAAHAVLAVRPAPSTLPVAVLSGAAVYAIALRVLHAVDREDADAFIRFAERAPRRLRRPAGAIVRFVGRR